MEIFRILFLLLIGLGLMTLPHASVNAGELKFKDCSATDKKNIKSAISWIKGNMKLIDRKMGKNGLMDWPGKSRKKFVAKIDKKLKFICKNKKNKCAPQSDGTVLFGKVVPVFKQRTIQLCTNNFYAGKANYVGTIAHEVAHLIRLNAHRLKKCKKYTNPRFSQSVGMAALHAYKNKTYKAENWGC